MLTSCLVLQAGHEFGIVGQIAYKNETYIQHIEEVRFSVIGTMDTEVGLLQLALLSLSSSTNIEVAL